MNRKILIGVAITAGAFGIATVYSRVMASKQDELRRDGKWLRTRSAHEIRPAVSPPGDPRISPRRDRVLDPTTVQNFVKESRNPAEAICLAYFCTYDISYIEKLKNHDNSEIALQMLSQYDVGTEAQLYWAEQFSKKNPANGLGKLLMARALLKSGNPDAAIKAFREALGAERISSPFKALEPALCELFNKISPSKITSFAIHDVLSAQIFSASELFPSSFSGIFENKTQDEAKTYALEICKLTDKLLSAGPIDLINVEGFSTSLDAFEGTKLKVLIDFERKYGEGSSKSVDSVTLNEMATQSTMEGNRRQAELAWLTPEQVDARVGAAIKPIMRKSNSE